VLFSHYGYYDRVFEALVGDDHTLNDRESWVRSHGRWVPYPFQNNLRYLPPEITYECLAGLIAAQAGGRDPAATSNFGEFIDAVFGEGIARHFMRPYNFKVWAYPPERMNKTWIGERVAVIDTDRALRNVILGLDDYGWGPNNRFKYPLGGTGDFYDRFVPVLGDRLRLGRALASIDVDGRVATFSDGTRVRYEHLLSTMPLDVLCARVLRGGVPDEIREAAGSLLHSGGHMVGVGIRRPCPSTRSWMYFPDDDCPFYRVTYLSNYSPRMTPDPERYYSLLCETSASPEKPVDAGTIVEETVRGLVACGLLEEAEVDDIVTTWHFHAAYSYPTPSVERDGILSRVIPWLEERGIYSRGRFGMWKYEVANTDHSLMQGVELVNRLLLGEAETTIGIEYRVTGDGRRAADHERPAHAGSGEKRLRPEVVVRAGRAGDREEAEVGEEEMAITTPRKPADRS
jgi:protoporphyrinogen oxidase